MTLVFLGADHAGFKLKEQIRAYLEKKGISYVDLGAHKLKEGDDYPDYAVQVGKKVVSTKNATGILVCGSGFGMAIAANKVPGIRAVAAYDVKTAKLARNDDFANILTLRGRGFSLRKVQPIISAWLSTPFSKEARHKRRVNKIKRLEK